MRTLLFCFLFSSASLSACICSFTADFCTYAAGYFSDSDTSAVIRHSKFIGFRNPEEGAYLYDFVVVDHIFGAMVADTVTLWGQDGGNCNGPFRQLTEGSDYLILHSATQGIFSYFDHTLENFSNPYPIYDFLGCGPAALDIDSLTISGPVAPGINSYSVAEFKAEVRECITGKLVGTVDDELPSVEFSAFPNPTSGALTLSFPYVVTPERIDILDITGRTVNTQNLTAGQLINQFNVDASTLPSGVYLVRVLLENGRIGSKRVIVH